MQERINSFLSQTHNNIELPKFSDKLADVNVRDADAQN